MVAPAEFLPLAHDAGLMATIDQVVLKQALHHISTLYSLGIQVPVSINLSVQSLSDVCMVDRVREALRAANVPPNLLEVEIPEGALMDDVETSAKVLADLNHMGVRISIDDFGTGYSSFAYLARFPVHTLKVDRSFVKEIAEQRHQPQDRQEPGAAGPLAAAQRDRRRGRGCRRDRDASSACAATWCRAMHSAGRCRSTSSWSSHIPTMR